jgi:predicted nucleotide-binding protein
MKKHEAIERLNALVKRTSDLQNQRPFSEDFKKWRYDVRAALKHVFPREKEYVTDFDEISYILSFSSNLTTDNDHQEAFRGGLRSARAMLQSRIDEVDQFWTDGTDAGESRVATAPENPKLVFVIHGRQLVGEFHDFLRALGLKPLEWSKARSLTGKPNPYTWEIVDKALSQAGAIVALLTPDDEARLREDLWSEYDSGLEKEYLAQPRQNVLFEAGVAYGRDPQRTILVRVGSQRPMSDLAGHHILQLDDSPQSRQGVVDALRTAGCPVDVTGTDWFRAGVFAIGAYHSPATAAVAKIREDKATLLLYKTQLKGFSDLFDTGPVVIGIHSFFASRPIYTK